ncbi:MAG TPA: GNAT family N-acetyltransferase [Aggregatilineales bacterium]|nr:GNAT family N-acetyltransferase [Anaerolineales bacterium]HRE48180.1 GNAT family N-acetyltransferase [Aggregatilineales bacterium]
MAIQLHEVTKDNWAAVCRLPLKAGQEHYVAPNWHSLLLIAYEGWGTARAIYDDETLVGFVLYGSAPDDPRWWVVRFMIAADHQRRGYGRTALPLIIQEMRERHATPAIHISFVPENEPARTLYASLGFVDTGTIEDGEAVYVLNFDTPMKDS